MFTHALIAFTLLVAKTTGFTVEYADCEVVEQSHHPNATITSFRYRLVGNCWLTSQRKDTSWYGLVYSQANVHVRIPSGGCLAPFTEVDTDGCISYDIRSHPTVAGAYIETAINDGCPNTTTALQPLIDDVVQRNGNLCKNGKRLLTTRTIIDEKGDSQIFENDFMLLGHEKVRDICYETNCVFNRIGGVELEGVWNRSNRAVEFRVLIHRGTKQLINGSYVLIKELGDYSIYGNKNVPNADNLYTDLADNLPYSNVSDITTSLARLPDGRSSIPNECTIMGNGSCVVVVAADPSGTNSTGKGEKGQAADCVTESYLIQKRLKCRYHEKSRMADVLCLGEICTTPNHIIIRNGQPLPMWQVCERETCIRKVELVNQPCVMEWVDLHGSLYDYNGVSILSGGDVLSIVLSSNIVLVNLAGNIVLSIIAMQRFLPVLLGFGLIVLTTVSRKK